MVLFTLYCPGSAQSSIGSCRVHTSLFSGYFQLVQHLGRVLPSQEGTQGHADSILASLNSQLSPPGWAVGHAVNGPTKSQFSHQLHVDNLC